MDYEIRLLSQKIINELNQARNVPIEAKRLVIVEILNQLSIKTDEIIKMEIEEQKHQEEQEKQEQTVDGADETI